ncbi:cyclin-like protein, partial [Protomyces lactucae-debilis]
SEKWLFTEQELKRTPSIQAGYSPERERTERMKGCDFIFKIGMKLRLLQSTIATACMFLHRFYMRFSLREYHYYDIGATSLFLATKCDENVKSLRSIVVECCKTAQKNEQLVVDEQSKEYWRWRDVLLYNEELLLEALCFDLVISHPYNDLRQYWKRLGGGTELRKCAWAFVNDTYRTRIVLMYKTPVIAAAALYFGSVFTDTALSEVNGEPWWRTLNVDLAQCEEVVQIMIELFETAPNL